MERYLIRYDWDKFAHTVPSQCDTAILPIGTVEAHGISGLGTDIVIPELLAPRLCKPLNAIICPTVNYGVTKTLLPYPGSLTVSNATLTAYLGEILISLSNAGFRKVILLNGHGGNINAVKEARERVWAEVQLFTAQVEWWLLGDEDSEAVWGEVGGHGALEETALFMLVHPDALDQKTRPDGKLAYCPSPGINAMPIPGAMILKEKGRGMPSFDKAKAEQYLERLATRLVSELTRVMDGWNQLCKSVKTR